ncbi:SH3 domain-containing protein [Pararhizobium mangrovi]|uniref:SH3 domain-containing protein n=1 Tax=Pararhizobium mangrovi TaxID=2590452 RepID=A0A506U1R8_9HYPH|nr:SH3 domain-containing protein [Pararhizobium mangrovi]TPW25797.1 SH3 domain-containing protein [Pararhizobium mangrovi]
MRRVSAVLMRVACVVLLALVASAAGALAASDITTHRLRFDPGTSQATRSGTIKGYQTVDYLLEARAGQTMTVRLDISNSAGYFNVVPPGSETAIHIGSTSGNSFTGRLPTDGDYSIRVYLMRSAARRGESGRYTLHVGISDDGATADLSRRNPDYADGLSGGPDFWRVAGLAAGDTLNLRSGPGTTNGVDAELDAGAVVKNLGCRMVDGTKWCRVELTGDPAMRGWAAGRYLVEAPAP